MFGSGQPSSGNVLLDKNQWSGVRGWGWGRRKGRTGLPSRPGCICSRGRWVEATDEGEARRLGINRQEVMRRWNGNRILSLGTLRRFLWRANLPSDDIKSSNRSPLISVGKQRRWGWFFNVQQDAVHGQEEVYLLLDQTCQKVLLESPTLEEKAQRYLNHRVTTVTCRIPQTLILLWFKNKAVDRSFTP